MIHKGHDSLFAQILRRTEDSWVPDLIETYAAQKRERAIMNRSSRLCTPAIVALIPAIWLMLVQPVAAQTLIRGDMNDDGGVDVTDVQLTVNVALGVTMDPPRKSRDMNGDGMVNVLDVQLVVNIVLYGNGPTITLPTANAVPLSPLKITTIGLTQGSPISVRFSDGSVGFSSHSTPFRVDPDGTVWVGVPIYINPQIGVTSGNVQVTVSQGPKSSGPQPLFIKNLPTPADLGTPLGRLSHAFLVFEAQVIANRIEQLDQTSVLLQNVGQSKDISAARSSFVRLLQQLIMARGDIDRILQDNTVVINEPVTTSDGIPIRFDASSVQAMDRIVGAWALQHFAPPPVSASTDLPNLVSANPATVARAELIPVSQINTTGMDEFIPANPTSTTDSAKLILISTPSTAATAAAVALETDEAALDIARQANDPNGSTSTLMKSVIGGVASVVANVTDEGTTVNTRADLVGKILAIGAMSQAFWAAGNDLNKLRSDMSQGIDTTQDLANLQQDRTQLFEGSLGILAAVATTPATIIAGSGALILLGAIADESNRVNLQTAQTESFLAIQKYLNSVHRASGEAKVSGKNNDPNRTVATPPDSTRLCCFGANSLGITGLADDSGNYSIPVPLGMSNTNYRSISITVSNPITGALRGSAILDLSGVNTGNPVIVPVSAPVITLTSPPLSCNQCLPAYNQCTTQCTNTQQACTGNVNTCNNQWSICMEQCGIVNGQCLAPCL